MYILCVCVCVCVRACTRACVCVCVSVSSQAMAFIQMWHEHQLSLICCVIGARILLNRCVRAETQSGGRLNNEESRCYSGRSLAKIIMPRLICLTSHSQIWQPGHVWGLNPNLQNSTYEKYTVLTYKYELRSKTKRSLIVHPIRTQFGFLATVALWLA